MMAILFFFLYYKLHFTVPFVLSRIFRKHSFQSLQTDIQFIEICEQVN